MTRPPRSLWRDAWSRLIHNKAAVAGAIVILFFMFVAIFAPVLAPHNPLELNSGKGFLPPMWVERSATGKAGTPEFHPRHRQSGSRCAEPRDLRRARLDGRRLHPHNDHRRRRRVAGLDRRLLGRLDRQLFMRSLTSSTPFPTCSFSSS
jgi:ABC-type dipeptide/oligopeptide/nickel transport system permease subunit